MRRALAGLMVAAVAGAGLVGLREATQNRADPAREGTATELTLEVRTRGDYPALLAAQGLWGVCQQTVSDNRLRHPLAEAGAGRFTVAVEPALGRHATRRLRGCLEDATVPRVSGRVAGQRDLVLSVP
ncbi:MAG: hypothetical protein ACRD0N_13575 [Acidimicrobiales bacterium]